MLTKNEQYKELLKNELTVAMGCTEPLAVAYAGSIAKKLNNDSDVFDKIYIRCSNNIIKNVRCVNVPNSKNLVGVKSSFLLGFIGGDYKKGFLCISNIDSNVLSVVEKYYANENIILENIESSHKLHIEIEVFSKDNHFIIEIQKNHLNVVKVIKNGEVLFQKEKEQSEIDNFRMYRELLDFDSIYKFINECDIEEYKYIILPQIDYNLNIAELGLKGEYGVSIGKAILSENPNEVFTKIKAYTASASEARMCGCEAPVIINSGSGNQGISSSVPIIVYAKEKNISEEKLIRALLFSNLLNIKQKYKIGTLSAFCGIVCSWGSSLAGITYLETNDKSKVIKTLKNHLATAPGIICDGAKASCAAKITIALESAILAHKLALNNYQYENNTGILKDDIDATIDIVGEIGSKGMQETDNSIIKALLKE